MSINELTSAQTGSSEPAADIRANDPAIPALQLCAHCDFQTYERLDSCPKCGKVLQTESQVRSHGSLMMVMGYLLLLLMVPTALGVAVLYIVALNTEKPSYREVDTSGRELVFFTIFLFCAGFSLAGYYAVRLGKRQQETGRRDKAALNRFLWICSLTMAIGTLLLSFA